MRLANVKVGNVIKSGRNNDLSLFGVDVYDWQDVELQVENKIAEIILNGERILSLPFDSDIGNIIGFNINFTGTGEVDFLTLRNQRNETVYHTDFD